MGDFNIGDGLRKVMLAGIGALATGVEKGQEIVDQLVEKGELTVNQGKELNTELKRKAQAQHEGPAQQASPATPKDEATASMPTPAPGTVYTIKHQE
ncbi:phasin family protein [Bombiscardovia coagulans]|uniref:Cytosolic protein n=1 Tax=Bombiscardovia coagulans TaxID=686666 RepID=A0A261EQY7_9BIFI|nr:hypothetical protein [Bombiscardovia coagulans]OZG49269.1 hypothetical protein BOCO_1078 [Bombiscardovia coagulans]